MSDNIKPEITPQEALDLCRSSINADLDHEGVTSKYLAKKLKRELNAKETKAQIPKGYSEFHYSKPMIAWDVRQKARQDAHKLRGDYPAEKQQISGAVTIMQPDVIKKPKNAGKSKDGSSR